jgi:hypothetical protein
MNFRAELTDNNAAGADILSAVAFYAAPLARAVTTVS